MENEMTEEMPVAATNPPNKTPEHILKTAVMALKGEGYLELSANLQGLSGLVEPLDYDTIPSNGWQPIETAPHDGQRITLYQPGRGTFEGWWHSDFACDGAYWMDDQDSEPDPVAWQPLLAGPFQQDISSSDGGVVAALLKRSRIFVELASDIGDADDIEAAKLLLADIDASPAPAMDVRASVIGKRAAEFIRMNDPFGDSFSPRDLQVLAGEPTHIPECCPVCGGDCGSANPPVFNCPKLDGVAR